MPPSGQAIPDRAAERLRESPLGRIVVADGPAQASGTPDNQTPADGAQADDATRTKRASPGRSGAGDAGGSPPPSTGASIRGFQADDALAGLPSGAVAAVLVLLGGAAIGGVARARRGRSV